MRYLSRFVEHCKVFSIWYSITEFLCLLDRHVMLKIGKPVSALPLRLKERYIFKWMNSFFHNQVEKYVRRQTSYSTIDNLPIWICWLQGEERAPFLVRNLIQRIRHFSGKHEVIIVTEDNYEKYCILPSFFVDKFKEGIVTPQQFSDLLRITLLAERGGVWIDPTCYVTKSIPDEVFKLPVYHVKNILTFNRRNVVVDATQWQSYFLAGKPGSVTYSFLRDCFVQYWRKYNTCIDYFLLFYIAKFARDNIPACRAEYDLVPTNNTLCEILNDYLSCGLSYTDSDIEKYLHGDTWLYKLTWKHPYPMVSETGSDTFASYLLNNMED